MQIKDGKIILYTVQPAEVLSTIIKDGIIKADKNLEDKSWPHAYDWLRQKMVDQNKLPSLDSGMFWAYGNLKDAEFLEGRIITIEKDISEVLLSDYCLWHSVLNNGPIPNLLLPYEHPMYEELYDKEYDRIKDNPLKTESWDNCLAYELKSDGIEYSSYIWLENSGKLDELVIQATFADIKLTEIKSIK